MTKLINEYRSTSVEYIYDVVGSDSNNGSPVKVYITMVNGGLTDVIIDGADQTSVSLDVWWSILGCISEKINSLLGNENI